MFDRWLRRNKATSGVANGSYRHGNDHLIELRDVLKVYESAAGTFTALKRVDLQIGRGEFVAIIGKSGSGKSTLLNMITGIDRPTSGQVLVGDTAVHTLSEGQMATWRGRNLGIVFQFFQLLPALSIVENVMLPDGFLRHVHITRAPRAGHGAARSGRHGRERAQAAFGRLGRAAAARGDRPRWPTIRRS
jgi:putative ABC transport system ATP-binding protein